MLKHVSFLTRDLDATLHFYTRLGAHIDKNLVTPEGFRRAVVTFAGGGRLQFFQSGDLRPAPLAAWQEHIAVQVPDLRALVHTLREQGVRFSRDLTLSPGGRDMAFVLDPDGRQVELLQQD